MPKLIFNKLVRDGIIAKIENNNEHATFEKLDEKTFEYAVNKKLLEELNEVLKTKTKEELTEELADLLEVIYTKAKLHEISYDEIEQSRIQKYKKYGGFDNRIFLIHTIDQEYVEANKGCSTCINDNCTKPLDEMNEESKYCINYKSPLNKNKK